MEWVNELLEIGRRLVWSGVVDSDHIGEMAALSSYWDEQRRRVANCGECAARCRVELVRDGRGELACPHTMRPCLKRQLKGLIEKWERVNR